MTLMRQSYQNNPMFPVGKFDDAKWRQYEWAYHRLIEKVDAQVGRVLQAIRENHLDRDTILVFLSDHGDCQGGPIAGTKKPCSMRSPRECRFS